MSKRGIPPRKNYNEPGHAHELTFSCYRRFKFLESDQTCSWLADSINDARRKWKFDLWAYVFMPEHVHLLVYPREKVYDIADIRKAIKAPIATKAIAHIELYAPHWLPKITRRRGKTEERLFWQSGGGYDRNFYNPMTLIKAIEYIHMNPVRRGPVERPTDWIWSSAAWFAGLAISPLILDPIPCDWLA